MQNYRLEDARQSLVSADELLVDLNGLLVHPIFLVDLAPDELGLVGEQAGPVIALETPEIALGLQSLANPLQIHGQIPEDLIVQPLAPVPLRDGMVVVFGAGGYVLELHLILAGVVLEEDIDDLVGLLDSARTG